MTKSDILIYLKNKKEELYKIYGITTLGLYGSYARDEASIDSDVDKVDFISLESMNPIIKHYAKEAFIYV